MKRRAFLKRTGQLAGVTAGLSARALAGSTGGEVESSSPHEQIVSSKTIELSSEKQVFVDWWFVEAGYGLPFTLAEQKERSSRPVFMPHGVRLSVIPPIVQPEPIIVPDTPADGILVGAYSTLMMDGAKYRLWYQTFQSLERAADMAVGYAESEDAVHWTKPNLGLVEVNGSKQNNIVYRREEGIDGPTVFKDPSAPAEERYKMIYCGQRLAPDPTGLLPGGWVYGATSPDGLHWTRLPEPLVKHESDTQCVAVYDEELRRYVAYLRGWEPLTVHGSKRVVKRTESEDFRRFPNPQLVLAPGPDDPPDMDIYTNAYQRWPGAARAHLLRPAFYHRASDTVDVHLAVSRDGIRWSRPSRDPLIAVGLEGSGFEGQVYAGVGIVPLGRGVWAFPIWRSYLTHNMVDRTYFRKPREGSLWLATLREDGFMALEAETQGECWTQVVSFRGSRLLVNSWARTGGRLRIELTTPDGQPIPGFALEDCDGIQGDALWAPVRWKGESDVSTLAGKPLRIRTWLARCRLHTFRFA